MGPTITNASDSEPLTSARPVLAGTLLLVPVLFALYLLSRTNYLLFHALVEGFSIVVACGVFMIAWNSRRFHDNSFFLCLGVASLFVAGVDFLHTLAYKNMGIFPEAGSNLPTQLWIVARYLEAAALLLAPFFLSRRVRPALLFACFLVLSAALVGAVFAGHFPDCFLEASGLTAFKIGSEYLICLLLAGSLVLVHRRRQAFEPAILRLLTVALGAFILAELSFTLYTDVFGLSNMAGHLFKVVGFYCLYRAVIKTGLTRPYDLVFRQLKQSEQRYRELYENTPVMLHSIDRQGRVVSVSDYWLKHLGYWEENVMGRKFTDFLDEESRRRTENEILPAFFRDGFCRDVPCRVMKKDGETIDVLLSAVAERDEQTQLMRSLAVMVDVTEQKRSRQVIERLNAELLQRTEALEEANIELEAANEDLGVANAELETANDKLAEANQDLETFNYSVSHDLRGPLTVITGKSQLALQLHGDSLDPELRDTMTEIDRQGRRMNEMVSTLLEFSRLGKVEPKRERVDLSTMARTIALELAVREPERRVDVRIAEGIEAEADPALLRLMLENLLGNAWKYTGFRDEAHIEFDRAEAQEDAFFVRDNGAGFDPAQADDIFSPFTRLHASEDFEGFGIGLATVQRIAQRHGGRAWAEGAPGEGATFYFSL